MGLSKNCAWLDNTDPKRMIWSRDVEFFCGALQCVGVETKALHLDIRPLQACVVLGECSECLICCWSMMTRTYCLC
jgi:hypothetical protein